MIGLSQALAGVMHESSLTGDALKARVRMRLQHVLRSAGANVPYYQALFSKQGFDPLSDSTGVDDLRKLPVTTRSDCNRAGTEALTDVRQDLKKCHMESTSGSSGIPLRVYRNKKEHEIQVAKWLRTLLLNGYRPWHKVLAYVHSARVAESTNLVQRLGLFQRRTVDYYLPLKDQIDALFESRPHVVYGNRCHLELIARECLDSGRETSFVRLVVVTGEVVHSGSRKLMESAFRARVAESYGSVEMGVMAHEIPGRKALVMCEDRTVFEFLDEEDRPVPPGVPGRVVVTDLTNRVQPFIRFDQGDWAEYAIERTAAGGERRVITRLIGRDDDYAIFPDGSRRSYLEICGRIRSMTEIRQYRIVQLAPSRFRMEVAAAHESFPGLRETLQGHFASLFPDQHFEIAAVDRILPDASGKIRKFVSNVNRLPEDML